VRRPLSLLVALVLGAGCTGDPPASQPEKADASTGVALPRCDASLGAPPPGFLLVRSREIRYRDHVGVREEYRHQDGRLLVYLLGVTGEMGEGATVAKDIELASGKIATLFGSGGSRGWSVSWSDEHPCPQLAVVGNGFRRGEFLAALTDSGILAGSA
jgi:hypothetical protein